MIHVGHNQTRADVYYKASATANYDRDTVASVGAATYFFWQVTYQVNWHPISLARNWLKTTTIKPVSTSR